MASPAVLRLTSAVLTAFLVFSCSSDEAQHTDVLAVDAAPDGASMPGQHSGDAGAHPADASIPDGHGETPDAERPSTTECGPLECTQERPCDSLWDDGLQPFVSYGPLASATIVHYERRCGMVGELRQSMGGLSRATAEYWYDPVSGELLGRTWQYSGAVTDEGCEGTLPGPDCSLEGECSAQLPVGPELPPCDPEVDLGVTLPPGWGLPPDAGGDAQSPMKDAGPEDGGTQ